MSSFLNWTIYPSYIEQLRKSKPVNVTSLANYNPVTLPTCKTTAELLAAPNAVCNTAVQDRHIPDLNTLHQLTDTQTEPQPCPNESIATQNTNKASEYHQLLSIKT